MLMQNLSCEEAKKAMMSTRPWRHRKFSNMLLDLLHCVGKPQTHSCRTLVLNTKYRYKERRCCGLLVTEPPPTASIVVPNIAKKRRPPYTCRLSKELKEHATGTKLRG
jgi:hypothetical protein